MDLKYWVMGMMVMFCLGILANIATRINNLLRQSVILQRKIDLALKHLGIEDVAPQISGLSAKVQEIASDPAQKIEAIKVHREETGASLKDAKDAVEMWMQAKHVS